MRGRDQRAVHAALLATLSMLPAGCVSRPDALPDFPLTSEVLSALASARPHVLRVSDEQRGVPCAPPDTSMLVPSAACTPVAPDVAQRLASLSSRVAAERIAAPSVDVAWASALLDLATEGQDPRRLDRVIARLREVREREPTRALVANHLALAHMARASAREDARDLFAALDYIEESVEQDSLSPAFRFNQALLHSRLGTTRQARLEWTRIVAREDAGFWRSEAALQLAALPAQLHEPFVQVSADGIVRDPQGAREFALDSLLIRWARATIARDSSGIAASLHQLRLVASALSAHRGDSSVAHVARELESTASAEDVITAVRGMQLYARSAFDSTARLLLTAVPRLRRTGAQATADWAELRLGGVRLAQRRYDAALAILEPIAARAVRRGDRALEARALWGAGVVLGRDGAVDESARRFTQARQRFLQIGESRNAATMANSLADTQGLLGRTREAANTSLVGFSELVRNHQFTRYEDLVLAADQLSVEGRLHAAAHYLTEALLAAGEGTRAKDRPEALGRLTLVYAQLGNAPAAAASLAEARSLASTVSDDAMRSRLDAELARAEAGLVADTDPARARDQVNAARIHFASNPLDDAPLLNQRAMLGLRLGDSTSAMADLQESIRETRAQLASAPSDQVRQLIATYRDAQRLLIEIALAKGDTATAFEETVRLSAIDMPDTRNARLLAPPLATDHAELRFVMLATSVLSWIRTSDGVAVVRTPGSRDALATRLWRFLNAARAGEDTLLLAHLGHEFYRTLIAPHEQLLTGRHVILLHADGVLGDVPLAALPDDAGRLIGDRFRIRVIVPVSQRPPGSVKLASAVPLLIGNPAWARTEHPDLEPLRFATSEVERVASLYPRVEVMSGAAATKAAVIAAMPRHSVIHFAGHSRVVVERAEASHLVLATGATYTEGLLTAAEIARLDLRGVRLVVLSSCGRTRDDATDLGEVNALAVAFLDAGVETVIAGAAEVEDGVAAAIALEAHKPGSAGPVSRWWRMQSTEYGR